MDAFHNKSLVWERLHELSHLHIIYYAFFLDSPLSAARTGSAAAVGGRGGDLPSKSLCAFPSLRLGTRLGPSWMLGTLSNKPSTIRPTKAADAFALSLTAPPTARTSGDAAAASTLSRIVFGTMAFALAAAQVSQGVSPLPPSRPCRETTSRCGTMSPHRCWPYCRSETSIGSALSSSYGAANESGSGVFQNRVSANGGTRTW